VLRQDFLAVFFAGDFLAVEDDDFFAVVEDFLAGADFFAVELDDFLAAELDDFLAVELEDFLAVDPEDDDFFAGVEVFFAVEVEAFFAGAEAFFAAVEVFLAGADFFAVDAFLAGADFEALEDFFAGVAAFLAAAATRAPPSLAAAAVFFGRAGSFFAPEITFLRSAPGVNLGTAFFLVLMRSPVCGFRTQRALRTLFSKEPKPVIATFSPLATWRVMVSSTESRACCACLRLPSKRSESASIN
jgi:hypothetical protein